MMTHGRVETPFLSAFELKLQIYHLYLWYVYFYWELKRSLVLYEDETIR
jgi:hypothetical protein